MGQKECRRRDSTQFELTGADSADADYPGPPGMRGLQDSVPTGHTPT